MEKTLTQKLNDFMFRNEHIIRDINAERKKQLTRLVTYIGLVVLGVAVLDYFLYTKIDDVDTRLIFLTILLAFCLCEYIRHKLLAQIKQKYKDDLVRLVAHDIHPNLYYGDNMFSAVLDSFGEDESDEDETEEEQETDPAEQDGEEEDENEEGDSYVGPLEAMSIMFGKDLSTWRNEDWFRRESEDGERVLFNCCEAKFETGGKNSETKFKGMLWILYTNDESIDDVCDYYITNKELDFGLIFRDQRLYQIDHILSPRGEQLYIYTQDKDAKFDVDINPEFWKNVRDENMNINVLVRPSEGEIVVAKRTNDDKFELKHIDNNTVQELYTQINELHELGMSLHAAAQITRK